MPLGTGSTRILFAPCESSIRHPSAGSYSMARTPIAARVSMAATGKSHPGTALDYVLGTYVRTRCAEQIDQTSAKCRRNSGYDEPGVLAAVRGDVQTVSDLIHEDRSILQKRYPSLDIGTTGGRMLTLKGATLLHVAAEFGHADVARLLMEAGAGSMKLSDRNGRDRRTKTDIPRCTQGGDRGLAVVRLLLERGADLSVRCRIPGHYERLDEVFEGSALDMPSASGIRQSSCRAVETSSQLERFVLTNALLISREEVLVGVELACVYRSALQW